MKLKKLIFLLVILAFCFPIAANAGDIDVNTGNVRVRSEQNGGISVNTGRNSIEVDRRRSSAAPWWKSWYYWNRHRRGSKCRSSTYQRSTQTTSTNGRTHTYSNSTSTCR